MAELTVKHIHSDIFMPFFEEPTSLFRSDFNLSSVKTSERLCILNFVEMPELEVVCHEMRRINPNASISLIHNKMDQAGVDILKKQGLVHKSYTYSLSRQKYEYNIEKGVQRLTPDGDVWQMFDVANVSAKDRTVILHDELPKDMGLLIVFLPLHIDIMHPEDIIWRLSDDYGYIHTFVYYILSIFSSAYVLDLYYRFFDYRKVFYFFEIHDRKGAKTDILCAKLSSEEVQFYYDLAYDNIENSSYILEVGTWLGGSGICFAKACKDRSNNSRLITIDRYLFEGVINNFKRAKVDNYVTMVLGDAFKVLPHLRQDLTKRTPIIFDDIESNNYEDHLFLLQYYDSILNPNGYIILQNYIFRGFWQRAVKEFLNNKTNYCFYKRVRASALLKKKS